MDGTDVASENATGFGTVHGEEEQLSDQLSDVSDTGWDTDLEIEGMHNSRIPYKVTIEVVPLGYCYGIVCNYCIRQISSTVLYCDNTSVAFCNDEAQ